MFTVNLIKALKDSFTAGQRAKRSKIPSKTDRDVITRNIIDEYIDVCGQVESVDSEMLGYSIILIYDAFEDGKKNPKAMLA